MDNPLSPPNSFDKYKVGAKPTVTYKDFLDIPTTRDNIFSNVLNSVQTKYPISNEKFSLEIDKPQYEKNRHYTLEEQKNAILDRQTLDWPLYGTWRLRDKATGNVIDENRKIIARVPYMTPRGTFILRGNEYTLSNQQRLRAGIYSRKKDNGELEAHVNLMPGTGSSFRIYMEPETGLFKLKIGQANVPAYPILKALGASDDDMTKAWGPEIFAANSSKARNFDLSSVYQKLASSRIRRLNKDPIAGLKATFAAMGIDPEVSQRNLGHPYDKIEPAALIRTMQKLLKINKGEEDQDDRDSQANMTIHGPEDLIAERISKDAGSMSRNLLWKVSNKRTVANIPSAYLTRQINAAIMTSGLGSSLSEINPMEILHQLIRVSRLGEGAITSKDAVPDEARNVQPSQLGLIDPVLTPECFSPDAEVLTKAGFKNVKSITSDDLIACNIDGNLEFHKPNKVIAEPYKGLMYGCDSKYIKYLVTPEHRMWIKRDHSNHAVYQFEFAYQTHEKIRKFNCGHEPYESDVGMFNVTIPVEESPHFNLHVFNREINIVDWAEFIGWYLGEGNLSCTRDEPNTVVITQSFELHKTYCEEIASVLNRIGFNYSQTNDKFIIEGRQLARYLMEFGRYSPDRHMPEGFIDWPVQARQKLLESLMKGEGRIERKGNLNSKRQGEKVSFLTTSSRLSKEFELLAISLGYATRTAIEKDNRPHVKTTNYRTTLHIKKEKAVCVKTCRDRNPYYLREHDGNVYCLSVPGEKLYVRYPNGMPFWTGNSTNIGIDSRLAMNTLKGSDGQLYRKVLDRNGKEKVVSSREMIHSVVAFPGELEKPTKKVRASIGGRIEFVDRNKVDYVIPSARDMFSYAANMVPMLSGIKGGRLLMGGKMIAQALPLQTPEAPLVQSEFGDGTSFEQAAGKFMGNISAPKDGRVIRVTPDGMDVIYNDKTKGHIELYDSFPLNQKTSLTNTPLVKAGDTFKANQLLAHSNFTDKNGVTALGTNLRTAYMVMKGNFEDAIVISESAAKKLSSEHMYLTKVPIQENLTVDKKEFISNFPGAFTQAQLDTLDETGVVKPGTVLHPGDPIAVGVNRREPTKGKSLLKQARSWNVAFKETWDHEQPGIVTDVSTRGGGIKVATKTFIPMKVGDKMVSRYANKGIVSKIYPDDQMPRNADGSPFEVVFNPLGIISRVNNSLLAETALAKIARKTGKPYVMPGFTDKSLVEYALDELKKNNIPETETVYDPGTNKELKNIFTGEQFIMKLHHTAEGKTSARDVGVYSMDNTPAKGQIGQSKRIGSLEMNALLAHNVPAVIRDAKLIRGQRNDDYWRKFRLGLPVPTPQRPFVYDKFLNMLKAAGINVNRKDDKIHVTAMTDKDVDKMAGDNELTSGDAINLKTMEPVEGGLFDVKLTGGRDSTSRWAKITLAEPMPNPTMEEPIRRLLRLTGPKFESLLRSEQGPAEILRQLKNINVNDEIRNAQQDIKSGKSSKRDSAVKILQYLTTAKKYGVHPSDWMITKIPVLPAAFRPVSHVDGMELTSDANLLYKDLFEANKNLKDLKNEGVDIGEDRMATYEAVKAVVGLGDPINIKNKEKSVAGMFTHIFGKSSPKFGMFQQKLLSTTVDVVGRAVISPDPKLDMDQVGIPADVAWDIYRPHIMRRLSRRYNSGPHKVDLTELAKWIVNKDPRAKKALEEEMENRPVIISRAPVWHKFGIMGAWPVLAEGNTMKLPPLVYPGFGADNDGDAMNFHVPASDEAVQEVIHKMLPSKNLISTGDFKLQMQPKQEFLLGLYLATKDKSKRQPRTFVTKADAIQAALAGQIDFNDPVIIKQ